MSTQATCATAWYWPTHERWYDEGIRRSLMRSKEAGFTHVNWNCDAGYSYIYAPSEIAFIAEMLADVGLTAWAVHGSHGKNSTTEVGGGCFETRKDFLSPNEWQRQAGVDLIRNRLVFAQAIGSPVVVMHFDIDEDAFADPDTKAAYFAVLDKSVRELRDDCERHNVRIALENLNQAPIEQSLELMDHVFGNHPASQIGLCYDSGHAELSEKGKFRILENFGDRLITTHLNDNKSVRDDHLLPGDGNIDFERLADLIAASPCEAPFPWETPYLHHGMGYGMGERAFFHRMHPLAQEFEERVAEKRQASGSSLGAA